MFLHGAKAKVGGFGRGLRTFYFLTNGSMTVLAHFMYKKNGIKGR
jgi:hypothetical protein